MGNIVFIKGQGGMNKAASGEDHISAILGYVGTLPSGFSSTDRIKEITDLPAAVALGIVNDKSDETKATGGKVVITTPGAAANVQAIVMDGVILGSYTVVQSDTNDLVAAGLRAAINAGTSGYVAAGTAADVTLTPPTGLGDSINAGTHLSFTTTGTGAATVTQFSGGVDAVLDVFHYHISECFRINPGVKLYVGLFAVPQSTYDFAEITTMQNFVSGKIRNLGICMNSVAFSTTDMTAIQSVLTTLEGLNKPVSCALFAANISAVTDLTTLSNLAALSNAKVSAVIGQDGGATGAALYVEKGYSITCLGALLGAVSLAKVNENVGWRAKFNMAAVELETPAIANGTLVNSLTDNALTAIDAKNYIFLKKEVDFAGTYFNDSWTAIARTNDYGNIEANRTMDKAIRGVRANLLPEVNSPVFVDPTSGKLAIDTVKYLEGVAAKALTDMESAREISGWDVVIDPNQDVVSTSKLKVSIVNVPVGVSRDFEIKISYSSSI
jgi:hypothetical protein